MSTCHCDGPPHSYDPKWRREGRDSQGRPIAQTVFIYPQGGRR